MKTRITDFNNPNEHAHDDFESEDALRNIYELMKILVKVLPSTIFKKMGNESLFFLNLNFGFLRNTAGKKFN